MFLNSLRKWRIQTGVALTATLLTIANEAHSSEELNALVWCDHLDPELVQPFEQRHGVKVNLREYEGTGTALALVDQSRPGDWDVFVVDSTDVPRVVARGLLAELDPSDYPWTDIPDALHAPNIHYVDGKLYAVPEKFGYNTVAFDKTKVDLADMLDANAVFKDKYADRIAVYDYYLTIISQLAVAIGKTPSTLSEADIPLLRKKLATLKKNGVLVGDIVTTQTALATGDVDILLGGGEFAVASLAAEKPHLDWVLPEQGGIRWQQAIGIFATSEKKDLAERFVAYILSPDAQAALATSSCFWGMPANSNATLTDAQKSILRWNQQPEYIAKSHMYPALSDEFDRKLQDLWSEFLQM